MFLLVIATVFAIVSLLSFLMYNRWKQQKIAAGEEVKDNFWGFVAVVGSVFSFVMFCALMFATMASYSDQINDEENLVKFERLEQVYAERAENLTKKFVTYLAETYPEYERGIFESIGPDGIDMYFVKYPELRTSETIIVLVTQIRSLQDDRYEQQVNRENTLKDMWYRSRNPWIFSSLIPEPPER